MTPDLTDAIALLKTLVETNLDIRSELQKQTKAIESLTQATRSLQLAPEYSYPLADFEEFDWGSIDARVITKDGDGVSCVQWQGRQYVRRYKDKFGNDIWFSCSIDGEYKRLITFGKTTKAESLPSEIKQKMQAARQQPSTQQPTQPRSKPTKDKKVVYLSVCKALNIVEDADIKALYLRSIHPFNFPKLVLCNNLSDNQFSVMIDNALVDWSITNLLLSEASAIAALNKLKATLQTFTPLELAQHWKALTPVPA